MKSKKKQKKRYTKGNVIFLICVALVKLKTVNTITDIRKFVKEYTEMYKM